MVKAATPNGIGMAVVFEGLSAYQLHLVRQAIYNDNLLGSVEGLRIHTMVPDIYWDSELVPEWANFFAYDSNGDGHFFENAPILREGSKRWMRNGGRSVYAKHLKLAHCKYFAQSCARRPAVARRTIVDVANERNS